MHTTPLHRLSLCIAAPLLLLAACGSLPNERAESVDHRLVEYSLNEHGTAAPTVIFENGLDGKMYWWKKVLPEVSKDATTFAYNRPGYGRSEPVSSPRDG